MLAHAWYYDEARQPRSWAARDAWRSRASPGSTRSVIDGAVNGVGVARALAAARGSASLQTGYVRNYALGIAVGAVVLVGLLSSRGWR